MKVKSISIKNYKGILDEELEFNDNLNVFIGSNGAGKTTILEAIFRSLLQWTRSFADPGSNRFSVLKIEDINYISDYCSLLLEVQDLELSDPNNKSLGKSSKHSQIFQEIGNLGSRK